jgi:hypothetical protein
VTRLSDNQFSSFSVQQNENQLAKDCYNETNAAMGLEIVALLIQIGFLALYAFVEVKKKEMHSKPLQWVFLGLLSLSAIFLIAGLASFRNGKCIDTRKPASTSGLPTGISFSLVDDYGSVLGILATIMTVIQLTAFALGKKFLPFVFADAEEINTAKV